MATRRVYSTQGWPFHKEVRRCPTLPQGHPCSTIGAGSLSFRVRNVTGRFPPAMAAETLLICESVLRPDRMIWTQFPTVNREPQSGREHLLIHPRGVGVLSICRLISTGQLHES